MMLTVFLNGYTLIRHTCFDARAVEKLEVRCCAYSYHRCPTAARALLADVDEKEQSKRSREESRTTFVL